MANNRPLVLMYEQHNECGLLDKFAEIVSERLQLIWFKEFKENDTKFSSEIVGIIIWIGKPSITEKLLDSLPNLKVIANVGVGYNHVDVPMVRKRGIRFSNTPNVLNMATAELGMTLMLCAARNIVKSVNLGRDPDFRAIKPNLMSPVQASGATLGIVGMGRIGLTLAKMAKGFNMKILYHNRSISPEEDTVGAKHFPTLNDMIPLCDFVVVATCLTPETTNIISTEQLKLMKKNAILVNISRGETIDQEALVAALDNNQLLGAALDVTSPEPLPRGHPLKNHPKVIVTPHIGSATFPTRKAMVEMAVENVVACLNGNKMPSEVIE